MEDALFNSLVTLAKNATATEDYDMQDANDTARVTEKALSVIHPYGFVAEDWYWMEKLAWWNAVLPALTWLMFRYWLDDSTRRTDMLFKIMIAHASVWSPLILIALVVNTFDTLKGFAAFWLEHFCSNFYQATYTVSFLSLLYLAVMEGNTYNWLLMWSYFFYFYFMDSAEQGSGTFAMYYLDPEAMTLDANFHPSFAYFMGWREHRYRYYYYYPQYTPDFSLLDKNSDEDDE